MGILFFFQLLSYAEAADYSTRYEYDSLRRLVKVIAPDNSTVKNIYNTYGQIILVERYSPAQILIQKTKTDYSLTGQPYKTYGSECFNYPSGSLNLSNGGCAVTTALYDALDRPDIITDGQGRKVKTLYYPDGQTHKIIKAYGTSLQQNYATYIYSLNGKAASVMDANGNVTTYDYDGHDRLSRLNLPSKNKGTISSPNLPDGSDYERYSYDPNGNLLAKRKRDGKIISMTYDALNRIIKKSPQGQTAVEYQYNRIGLQIEVKFAGSAASIRHHYDSAGRLS